MKIEFYTDGSCDQNKSWRGAYGVVTVVDGYIEEQYSSEVYQQTTNNKMELEAIIYALKQCTICEPSDTVVIYSDSQYCVNGVNSWMFNWERKGWKRKKNQPVLNLKQWKEIYSLYHSLENQLSVVWIKGHNGNIYNEMADELATHYY